MIGSHPITTAEWGYTSICSPVLFANGFQNKGCPTDMFVHITATKGTFLAEQVEKYQCGWNIDSSNDEGIKQFVENLTIEEVNKVSTQEKNIADDFAFDNNDKLKELLNSL